MLGLLWGPALETPEGCALEEPLLPSVKPFESFEGELLDISVSELEAAFFAPEGGGVSKWELPVRNPLALSAGPSRIPEGRGRAGEPTLVGVEYPVTLCVIVHGHSLMVRVSF